MSATVPVKKAWDHAVAAARKPIFPVRFVIAVPLFDADAEAVQLAAQRIERHPIAIKHLMAAIHLFSHQDRAPADVSSSPAVASANQHESR
jgi:hypothetical protein